VHVTLMSRDHSSNMWLIGVDLKAFDWIAEIRRFDI